MEKVKAAVQAAKDAVSELFQAHANAKAASNDSLDESWPSDTEYVPNIGGIVEDYAHILMEKLPGHLLFTAGFDGKDEASYKLYLCLSSKKILGQWLKMFGLLDGSINTCNKPFKHLGLMDHLKDVDYKRNNSLHVGAHAYLRSVSNK